MGPWQDDRKFYLNEFPSNKYFLFGKHNHFQGMVASNSSKQIVKPIVLPSLHTLCGSGRPFIRVAAISGASALAVQWYFEYLQNKKKSKFDVEDIYSPDSFTNHSKELFLSVNVMHLMHSVALLSVPLCRSPFFVSIFVLIVEYIH